MQAWYMVVVLLRTTLMGLNPLQHRAFFLSMPVGELHLPEKDSAPSLTWSLPLPAFPILPALNVQSSLNVLAYFVIVVKATCYLTQYLWVQKEHGCPHTMVNRADFPLLFLTINPWSSLCSCTSAGFHLSCFHSILCYWLPQATPT